MINNPSHRLTQTLIALALVLSAGCASINLDTHVAETAEQALNIASDEDEPERAQRYLLRIAANFQAQGNHPAARMLLKNEQLLAVEGKLKNQRQLLAMVSARALDDEAWASELATTLSSDSFLSYPPEQLSQAADLQAGIFAMADRPLAAAMTLILLSQTDNHADLQEKHDRIWQHLKSASGSALSEASARAIGFDQQGWLELASLLRQPDTGIDEKGRQVRRWQNNWPGHPATRVLPAELQLLTELAISRPERIVLALPMQGPLVSAGRAIRDGFLAAYFSDESADRRKTDIRIMDSSSTSFGTLYQKLITQNIDLIVGPLEKEALSQLSILTRLPTPVLGLNYLPEGEPVPDNLFQFGLSAEDEARQIADLLAAENLKQILAIIPYGEWGDRVERALLRRLQEHNGTALDVQRFFPEDNLRSVTADLLGVTSSRQRAIQVERTIGINVEFEPRRRQDPDAIVLVAEPSVARQLNPLFDFYFAGDLPVFAPSIAYEGRPDPARDQDLNQVIFTDIPWVLAERNPLRQQASQYISGTHGQLGRLFAMGADAWQLSKRLPLLQQVSDARIKGQTGHLTMNERGVISRQQLWARFQNGEPAPAPEFNQQRTREDTTSGEPVTAR